MAPVNETNWLDGFIWIGESYKKILCSKIKESCGVPITNERNKCYVHEAEWRGCCRKVPGIPGWVVPGKTRIFLAHRDKLTSKERGRIFGYFVLERIELTKPAQQVIPMEINPVSSWQLKRLENSKKGVKPILEGMVYRVDTGKPIEGVKIAAIHTKTEKKEKTITGRDGYYKLELEVGRYHISSSTAGFKNGILNGIEVSFDEKSKRDFYLVPAIPGECEGNRILKKKCPDGAEIVTHLCRDGVWVATGEECPDLPGTSPDSSRPKPSSMPPQPDSFSLPIDITMFETHRSCSLRFKPGGIYLVDALTAAVTDRFNMEMRNTNILENYKRAAADTDRKHLLEEGNKIFKDILLDFRKTRKAKTSIPSCLKDKAKLRGELVLFTKPLFFENYPQASFKGLRRIDGDDLIGQIAAGAATAAISYYTGEASVRDLILAQTAKELNYNFAAAERAFNKFIELFKTELKQGPGSKLVLPGFGTFSVTHRKARMGRNPKTGEKIEISARDAVTFKAAKSLKESVNKSGKVSQKDAGT
jgi:DNA-binding protein HU-beta